MDNHTKIVQKNKNKNKNNTKGAKTLSKTLADRDQEAECAVATWDQGGTRRHARSQCDVAGGTIVSSFVGLKRRRNCRKCWPNEGLGVGVVVERFYFYLFIYLFFGHRKGKV